MAGRSPDDFEKALAGKRWRQAPVPGAVSALRALGILVLLGGIVLGYFSVWIPAYEAMNGTALPHRFPKSVLALVGMTAVGLGLLFAPSSNGDS